MPPLPLLLLLLAACTSRATFAYQYGRSTQHLGKTSCGRDHVVNVLSAGWHPQWTRWHRDGLAEPDEELQGLKQRLQVTLAGENGEPSWSSIDPSCIGELYLSWAHMDDLQAVALGSAFAAKSLKIKALMLAENTIGDLGMSALAIGIAEGGCASGMLEQLYLGENTFGPAGVTALATEVLEAPDCRIKMLYLYDNAIRDEGIAAIAEARPASLEQLNVKHTGITAVGAEKLADLLSLDGSRLHTLDAGNNALVGDVGAASLAAALGPAIATLYLRGCGIGDAGAIALAASYGSEGSGLWTLDLTDNLIGDAGALALVSALEAREASDPLYLYLAGNRIGEVGLAALASAHERQLYVGPL